jgi:hypothetical protein
LWAITWTASQTPLAANFPDGRWFKPTPYFQVADRVLDLGMAPMVGLEDEGRAVPVGADGVVPAMKDFVVQLPHSARRVSSTDRDRGWRRDTISNGQAGMTLDLESAVVIGRPCDSPGCASSADP